jgi:hypothetical protein
MTRALNFSVLIVDIEYSSTKKQSSSVTMSPYVSIQLAPPPPPFFLFTGLHSSKTG